MRKILKLLAFGFVGLILLVAIAGIFTSGGETTAPVAESTPAPATETKTEAAPEEKKEEKKEEPAKVIGIGESLKVGDVVYTVHGRTEATNVGGEWGETAKGKYLILDVTVKNEGKEALMVDSSLFKVKSGDTTYESDAGASMYANDSVDFFYEEINSGIELKGNVVFDIPADAHGKPLTLEVMTGIFGTETGQIALQ